MFGKKREFAEAYNELYPVVFSTVCRKVGIIEDAEDICQELFIKLYNKMEEIENKRKWLYGALKLEVMAYFRKKKPGALDIEDIFNDAGLAFVNGFRETRIIINDAIKDMDNFKDETDRVLFDLVGVKSFTYEEASAQLGLSKWQVRYRYGLIVERLCDYFRKKGINSLEDLL
ncbi:MAG: sigma-70 family RNA polymerase sigma factor [Spirochaetes bacterium]|nr:sigma-70 family RNA polymerase sigma factor [Spirochaetota bacterium]